MGERIHATATASPGSKRKWAFIIAGTAVALITTGVLVQVLRPAPAYPGDGRGEATAAQAEQQATVQTKNLARVGKTYITYDQVAAECVQRYGDQILENLINRQIIYNACQSRGVVISEGEVEREIVTIAKKFNLDTAQWLKMLEGERDIKPAQYRRDIIWPMLALRKMAGEEVELKEADLQKAFERNYGVKVKARAIVMDNQRRATEVWNKVNQSPKDFAKLARQWSIDPASRPLDGVVPPIRRHGGSPELEAAAFALQPGEFSGVIQVGTNQWVILLCEGHTEQVVKDITEVREILERDLREEKQQQLVAELFESIRKETRVDNYLRGTTTGNTKTGNVKAGKARGASVRQTSGTAESRRVSPADLSEDEGSVPVRTPSRSTPRRSAPTE